MKDSHNDNNNDNNNNSRLIIFVALMKANISYNFIHAYKKFVNFVVADFFQ